MDWFKGTIAEAITKAKNENGIFVVFVYDKSELSTSSREKLNDGQISTILSSSKYVAIEIENGSNDVTQFTQIYPLIVIPSLFFISPQNGTPLEIVGGTFEVKTLLDKINKISKGSNEPKSQPQPQETSEEQSSQKVPSASTEKSNETLGHHSDSEGAVAAGASSSSVPTGSSTSSVAAGSSTSSVPAGSSTSSVAAGSSTSSVPANDERPVTLDEKLERAKELLNKRQELKNQQELEEEKQKEIERRRQSQELVAAQQKKKEQERLNLSNQRKKEKEEDRLAREKVKAQIAADRAERLARAALLAGEAAPPSQDPPEAAAAAAAAAPAAPSPNRSGVTRLKFRFSDNSSESAEFPPEATLADVRSHLLEKSRLSLSRFRLVATLPPRSFTDADMPQTLSDLGLTPSAIIIVKPITSSPAASMVPSSDGFFSVFWSLLAPLTFILDYLRGFLGGGGRRPQAPAESSDEEERQVAKKPRTEGSYTTRHRPRTAYGRRSEPGQSGGLPRGGDNNIHRLRRDGDDFDDDDNNTWNGNSTQQM